jgi:hypothetical protein
MIKKTFTLTALTTWVHPLTHMKKKMWSRNKNLSKNKISNQKKNLDHYQKGYYIYIYL